MFGDNLSFISDTTIAATRTQGVEMKEKFKANFAIALPAALATLVVLVIAALTSGAPQLEHHDFNLIQALPYLNRARREPVRRALLPCWAAASCCSYSLAGGITGSLDLRVGVRGDGHGTGRSRP